jgi:5'-nucleotidase
MNPMFALLLALSLSLPSPQTSRRCIAIVGTNDVHGAIEPEEVVAQHGPGHALHGGVLAFSGYLHALRERFPDRLAVLDAGDIFQGTMPSNLSNGRAMIVAYNALGYDAAAIGNHEFDFGAEGALSPHAQAEAPAIDRTGVLKSRIAEANFPFLAVNIDERLTQTPIRWKNVRPSVLKEIGGIKVGILGASTPSTPYATRAQNVAHLTFADPGPRIVAEAKKLRQAGAQLVVLVSHMGGACNLAQSDDTWASCKATPGKDHELLDVLGSLPKGTVDVAVGGHTHQFMAHWLDQTAIIESGSRGQYLGLVEACVTEEDGVSRFDTASSRIHLPIPLCLTTWEDGTCTSRSHATPVMPATLWGRSVEPQSDLVTRMAPFLQAVSATMNRSLQAYLPESLSASAVGMLTAEAMRRQMRSDFGLHNAGGVRTGLSAGALTYGQVFEALPFDNYVTQVTLTGAQIEALAKILNGQGSRGRTTQFANLRIVGRGAGEAVVDAKGRPLQADRLYTLSTTDFVVEGGDGAGVVLDGLHQRHIKSSEVSARDATAAFISQAFAASAPP